MEKFKSLIEEVRKQEPMSKEFIKAWREMTDYFWALKERTDPKRTYDERSSIPHINFVQTSKTASLYGIMNHDISATFWYRVRFDPNEFWEGTLKKVVDLFERYAEGKDDENPDTIEHLVWRDGELKRKKVSTYNVTGTPYWRDAWIVRTEEQRLKELENTKRRLENLKEEEERYFEKYGKGRDLYKNRRMILENQIDLLEGRITNDKSMFRVLRIKEKED